MYYVALAFFAIIALLILKKGINALKQISENISNKIIYYARIYPLITLIIVLLLLGFIISSIFFKIAMLLMVGATIYYIYIVFKEKDENKKWVNKPKYQFDDDNFNNLLIEISNYLYDNETGYINKYKGDDIPLGRTASFLSYFNKSIYQEELYFIALNYGSGKNDCREYGYLITNVGIYFSDEKSDKFIPFGGIKNSIAVDIALKVSYVYSKTLDTVNVVIPISENAEISMYLSKKLNNIYLEGLSQYLFYDRLQYENILTEEEKNRVSGLDASEKILNAAGIEASAFNRTKLYNENKNYMNGDKGYGYAAEYGNITIDRLFGKNVINEAQNLDINGKQKTSGADRIVNGVPIQTKYCQSASETIGAAFKNKQAIYTYTAADGSTQMMQIEVPYDQYGKALKFMKKRIDSGQVPGAKPGDDPRKYVKRGYFSYHSSFCIAQSGTVQSLTVDFAAGCISASGVAGISAAIMFAQSIWNGKSPDEALKDSLKVGASVMGKSALVYTITMQLSRDKFANLFKKEYAMKGVNKEIEKGYQSVMNPIYKVSDKVVNKITNSSLASSKLGETLGLSKLTTKALISNTVTVAIVFGPDTIRTLQGKMSGKQLFKNSMVAGGSMAGAVIGTALLSPVIGSMIGGAIGGFVSKIGLDGYIEDDAIEMFNILKSEYIDNALQSNLTQNEMDILCKETLQNKKIKKILQNMYQSGEPRRYAKESIMIPVITKILSEREFVSNDAYDQALTLLIQNS